MNCNHRGCACAGYCCACTRGWRLLLRQPRNAHILGVTSHAHCAYRRANSKSAPLIGQTAMRPGLFGGGLFGVIAAGFLGAGLFGLLFGH